MGKGSDGTMIKGHDLTADLVLPSSREGATQTPPNAEIEPAMPPLPGPPQAPTLRALRSSRFLRLAIVVLATSSPVVVLLAIWMWHIRVLVTPSPRDPTGRGAAAERAHELSTPTVRILFDVTPPSASIRVNGKPHTGDLVVPRDGRAYRILISSGDDFEPLRRTIIAHRSQALRINLAPVAARRTR